jgi:hypothetical protein
MPVGIARICKVGADGSVPAADSGLAGVVVGEHIEGLNGREDRASGRGMLRATDWA